MDSTKIVAMSSLYLLFFAVFGLLTGVGQFPPPPAVIPVLWWSMALSFWQVTTLVLLVAAIIIVVIIMTIRIHTFGVTVPQTYIATIVMMMMFLVYLVYLFSAMFSGMPLLIQAIMVWPFIFILAFAIVKEAGRAGGK